jgi:hypothetical protein
MLVFTDLVLLSSVDPANHTCTEVAHSCDRLADVLQIERLMLATHYALSTTTDVCVQVSLQVQVPLHAQVA